MGEARRNKAKRSVFSCKTFLKTTEAVTNEKEVNTEIVCSHEQEDVSDQIIDNIVQTPYVAPDLMNSNNLHIEIDGNGKMDMA